MTALTVAQVRNRYLFLHGLRWLPVGFLIPVVVLLFLERGLTVSQIGVLAAVQGVTVMLLEVPTGGLSDAFGRRPVLLVAGLVNLASLVMLVVADQFAVLVVFAALQGVFRALDSGPLEAWYVDAVLDADPRARLEGGLSGGGVVLSGAIAVGALGASGLVALHPVAAVSALTLPVVVAAAIEVFAIAAVGLLVREVRTGPAAGAEADSGRAAGAGLGGSIGDVPALIGDAVRLLRRSWALVALIVAELLWAVGGVTFETLMPVRLSEVVAGATAAAEMMGPAGTAAWVASALGAALATRLSRVTGVPVAVALLRAVQGATVIGMGLMAGAVGVIAAFVATYLIHGAANPLHNTLLHRQVDGPYRATVLSLNSMAGRIGLVVGSLSLTVLSDATSVTTAIVVGALVTAAAAPLYLPSRRPATAPDEPTVRSGTPAGPVPQSDAR